MVFGPGMGFHPQSIWLARTPEASHVLSSTGGTHGMLEARVLETRKDGATLEIGGQRVEAKSHVPLNVGDRLWVRAEQQPDHTIRLAIQASEPEGGGVPSLSPAALDEQLRETGLPVDERLRLIARALIARDGVLERQAAVRLAEALRVFSRVSRQEVGAAALLQRAGVALSPAVIAQAGARADATAPLQVGAALHVLQPHLERLATRGQEAPAHLAQQVLQSLASLARVESATDALRGLQAWVDWLTPSGAWARESGVAPRTHQVSLVSREGEQTEDTPAKVDGESLPAVSVSQPGEALGRINYVNPGAKQGPDLAGLLAGLARLLGGNQAALKQRLNEAVAEIRTLQLTHTQAANAASRQEAALVPLFLPTLGGAQQASWIEIHPQRDTGKGDSEVAAQRLTLVLDTEFLGTLRVDVSAGQGVLHVSFGVAEARNRNFLASHVEELQESLSRLGLKVGSVVMRPAPASPRDTGSNPTLADAVQFDRRV